MTRFIRRALLLAFSLLALVAEGTPRAHAQNTICATAPEGDSSNRCASTAFVTRGLGPIVGPLGGVLTGTLPNPGMASGAAATNIGNLGGDLTGTLPNPALVNVLTAGGPLGDPTTVPVITWDAKGRLTAVSSATITIPQVAVYNTVADLTAANVPASTNQVTTLGYHTIGDGGGSTYVRVGSAPALLCYQQSNSGSTYWDLPDRSAINVKWCGAYGDASHDDYTAITNAIGALTPRDGTINFPVGNYYVGSTITILDKKYIAFVGPGSSDAPSFGDAIATITYTPSSGNFLHLDGTQAIRFSNLALMYNSATYSGTFINLRHSAGAVITDFTVFENFLIGGTNASSKNANLVDAGMTINTYFKSGYMNNGNAPIVGAWNSGDYSNGLYVDNVLFNQKLNFGPVVGGISWSFTRCLFEPLRGDGNAWGFVATSFGMNGLSIRDTQFDDAQGGGSWIDFFNNSGWGVPGQLTGVSIDSNFFQGAQAAIRVGNMSGYSITNNHFVQPSQYPILTANTSSNATIKSNHIKTSAGDGIGLMMFGGFPTGVSEIDNNDGNGLTVTSMLSSAPASVHGVVGEIGLGKITASASAPGAASCKISAVAGTNAGTCKLISYCGTSATPTTLLDNIGSGC